MDGWILIAEIIELRIISSHLNLISIATVGFVENLLYLSSLRIRR